MLLDAPGNEEIGLHQVSIRLVYCFDDLGAGLKCGALQENFNVCEMIRGVAYARPHFSQRPFEIWVGTSGISVPLLLFCLPCE